jgi:hypothetical protein
MATISVLVTYDADARTCVSLHRTEGEAYWYLVEFMRTYWDCDTLGYIPDDVNALVERYLKENEFEWSIHPVEAPWLEAIEDTALPVAMPAGAKLMSRPGIYLP